MVNRIVKTPNPSARGLATSGISGKQGISRSLREGHLGGNNGKNSASFFKTHSGLILYALGIVLTIQANIGYGPWEVFHVGLSAATGLSIGGASIIVGLIIVVITVLMGERIGIGTLLNMLLIGFFSTCSCHRLIPESRIPLWE
jgi:hypothetical protein